jgi:hypothetical protein
LFDAAWRGTKARAAGQYSGVRLPQHERSLGMDQSRVWGPPRYIALIVVLALHTALLAALLMASADRRVSLKVDQAVELLVLPPPTIPRIRAESAPARRVSGDITVSVPPPVLDLTSSAHSPGAVSDGKGSGVDWAAEARRALRAYEIRKRQPPTNPEVLRSPAEENWWPQVRHRAGDQFKTPGGDWIVWVSENCYQVASADGAAAAPGTVLSPTICEGEAKQRQ